MSDKPKDRATMWMRIIASIMVLIAPLTVLYLLFFSPEETNGEGLIVFFLFFFILSFKWKTVAGVLFVMIGLFFMYIGAKQLITGSYTTHFDVISGLIIIGLLPFIGGLLFLAIWGRTRKAKAPANSDQL